VDIPSNATTGTSVSAPNGEDGRDGMAFDPTSATRAAVIGYDGSGNQLIQLFNGLNTATPTASSLTLQNVTLAYSVSITPDGKYALVGTDSGLVLISGIQSGTLTQVNTTPDNVSFTSGGSSYTLDAVPTLGITLDGLYVAALTNNGPTLTNAEGPGSLVLVPITPTAASPFGAPVGVLSGVAVPSNDQILMH